MRLLTDVARLGAKRYGTRTAIVFEGCSLTFSDLDAMSNRYALRLAEQGIARGDLVGLMMENCLEFPVVAFAVMKLGAVLVPFNFRYRPDELTYVVNDTRIKLLVSGPECLQVVRQASMGFAGAVEIVDASSLGLLKPVDEPVVMPEVDIEPSASAMVMYTSGTTGFPKGAVATHAAFIAIITSLILGGDLHSDDVVLVSMPLFHNGGLNAQLMPCLALGGRAVLLGKGFAPDRVLGVVERERVTVTMWVPTMLALLVDASDADRYDVRSLRSIWYGSSPISPVLLAKVRKHFDAALYQFYGMTETGMTAVLPAGDHAEHAHCTGRELFHADLRIVDELGADVPVGHTGELLSRQHPLGMSGYLNNPEATAATIVNGWIRTGDVARNEGDGLFTIVDRLKDMLISGAENIYPSEIENCIARHPSVREVAVFGIPDDVYGEVVCAAVVAYDDAPVSGEAIVEWCAEHIASYKKPRRVLLLPELPKNATGKVTKHVLRAPFWQGHERTI
ncbi:MAG: AMP-binding protein [Rubrivivax sp.]